MLSCSSVENARGSNASPFSCGWKEGKLKLSQAFRDYKVAFTLYYHVHGYISSSNETDLGFKLKCSVFEIYILEM